MVLEIAEMYVRASEQPAFEEAIERALRTIAEMTKGFKSYHLHKGIESPERYVMQVWWESKEDHTGIAAPAREIWRSIVAPFFSQPAKVEHFTLVTAS